MKVAIVGTYPAGIFEKFKNYFSEKPEIEVVEVDTQEKFDALTEADAIVLRILKMPKEVVARIKGLKMIMRWGAGFDSVDVEEAGMNLCLQYSGSKRVCCGGAYGGIDVSSRKKTDLP